MATWNPTAIYGAIAAMSDADLLRWAIEEMARDTAHRGEIARIRPGYTARVPSLACPKLPHIKR